MAKEAKTKETKEKEIKKNVHTVPVKIEGEQWKKAVDKSFAKVQKLLKLMASVQEKYQEIFMKNILVRNYYLKKLQIYYYKKHI